MGTVTVAFVRALASAAGLKLTADGQLFDGEKQVRRIVTAQGRLSDKDYFDIIDWVSSQYPDRAGLAFAYAEAVDVDNLGALGLAMKTAPTLRGSLERAVRYFRLLTDTVAYQLDDRATPYRFRLLQPAGLHSALNLRNECALAGFGRVFRQFVGPELQFESVSFRHAAPGEVERYEDYFNCPVRFEADENAIALVPPMLDLPTRLGDPAVSRFLTDHLDAELGALSTEATIERVLAEHLSEALSDGIPKAGHVARAVGMSERTLYRRLSEAGLSYQDVLENTQKSLAETLLSEDRFSIAEVAFLTGFAEQSSFNRAFKRWAGQTPGAFRKGVHPA